MDYPRIRDHMIDGLCSNALHTTCYYTGLGVPYESMHWYFIAVIHGVTRRCELANLDKVIVPEARKEIPTRTA